MKFLTTLFLIFLCQLIFFVQALNHYHAVIDDAYISFRYASNFARGEGLVFNPGEVPTEGFSNFLWTLIIGLALWLFEVDPMYFAKILGLLATAGLIIVSYLFSRMAMGRWSLLNFIPPLIVASNTYLAHWSVMGLESSAFVLLIFSPIYFALAEQKYRWRFQLSPIVAAISIMTRIEAGFFLGILFATFWLVLLTRGEFKLKRFAIWMLEFLMLIVPYMLFRWFYYHSILPNPYYAKVAGGEWHSRGLAQLFFFFFAQGWGFMNLWLVPALVALFWRNRHGLICVVMLLVNAFYVWYVNGDWMPDYRFLLPALPFVGLNLIATIRLVGRFKFLPAKIFLLLLLFVALYDYAKFHFYEKAIYVWDWKPHRYPKEDKRWFYPRVLWQNFWRGFVPPLQNVADWLLHNVPDGAQIMTSDIGYPGFLNLGVRIIDIDGLTDRFIARAGSSPSGEQKKKTYIMEKEPEFICIFINHSNPNPSSPGYPYPEVSRLIYNSGEFRQNYTEVDRMNKYMNSWNHLYKRKDAARGLSIDEKIQRLQAGIKRNPRIFYLYTELIKLCKMKGLKSDVWLPYVEKAEGLFKGNAENMRQLGDHLIGANQLERAQRAYRESLRINPKQPILYTVLADLYLRSGKEDEALAILNRGLKYFPQDYGILAALNRIEGVKKAKTAKQ